ncbi:recombinase family protein [Amycolatopsis sp. NPDC049159]|uniref:recombinase family protein n=1 Tax=Amycolatopsis sp. NPDC049159 TaxID=3157210 RepID=UPI00340214BC
MLVTANGEADLPTDSGRMFARIQATVARGEIERKAARQRAAALQRAEHGKSPLGVRSTGYTSAREVIESEAVIVRELFDRFAAGDSLRALAAWLTEADVSTRHGRPWNPSGLGRPGSRATRRSTAADTQAAGPAGCPVDRTPSAVASPAIAREGGMSWKAAAVCAR